MARRSKARSLSIAIRQSPVFSSIIESPDDTSAFATAISTATGGEIGSGGSEAVATAADLPLVGNETGDFAFVEETNRLYIWNGNGWYNIALVNTSPSSISGNSALYNLSTDGTPTVITLSSTDPEGVPLVWEYEVTSGSASSVATISHNENVFTITPTTNTSNPGTFEITFTATDGINTVATTSEFSLVFAPPPSGVLFSTPGVYTWVCPVGVTEIDAVCIGGGGGGVGHSYGSDRGGSGGGGGSLVYINNIQVTPLNSYRIEVGAGGAVLNTTSNTLGTKGNDGGQSAIYADNTTDFPIAIANGGKGGVVIRRSYNTSNGHITLFKSGDGGAGGIPTVTLENSPGASGAGFSGGTSIATDLVRTTNTGGTTWFGTTGGSTGTYISNGADGVMFQSTGSQGQGQGVYGSNSSPEYGQGGHGDTFGASNISSTTGSGVSGAVRIIWGLDGNTTERQFPDIGVSLASSTAGETTI